LGHVLLVLFVAGCVERLVSEMIYLGLGRFHYLLFPFPVFFGLVTAVVLQRSCEAATFKKELE